MNNVYKSSDLAVTESYIFGFLNYFCCIKVSKSYIFFKSKEAYADILVTMSCADLAGGDILDMRMHVCNRFTERRDLTKTYFNFVDIYFL